jgi:hypothetical protein
VVVSGVVGQDFAGREADGAAAGQAAEGIGGEDIQFELTHHGDYGSLGSFSTT